MISPSFCAALPSASAFASSTSFAASFSFSRSSASLTAASIFGLLVGADLLAVLGERLLHAVHQRVERVARLHDLDLLPVVLGMRFGVLHHPLDLVVGEARARLDPDLVLLAGRLVLRRHVQDAVGVDVERDLDLRHAARRGRNALEVELAEALVARRDVALALQHVDRHRALVVVGGREHLLRLGRDRRVLLDELGHHAAERLDAERQRRHVEQQHVLDLALQHAALDRGADGDRLVRDSRPCAAPCRRTP